MRKNLQHILLCSGFAVMLTALSSGQAYADIVPKNMAVHLSHISAVNTLNDTQRLGPSPKIIRLTQKKISASKAKKIARSQVRKGEVVDISLRKNTYKVRLIAKNGRVVDVLIDARTGRIK